MSQSNIILALVALASMGLAGGLWVSKTDVDAVSLAKIQELEAQLKDARAQLEMLEKVNGQPKSGFPAPVSAADGSGLPPPPMLGATGFQNNGLRSPSAAALPQGSGLNAVPQPQGPLPVATVQPTDPKEIKRLAEAEASYADLISKFGLQPDEKEFFKQLAARRATIRKEATAKLQDPTLTSQDRSTMLAAAKGELDTNDEEIRNFLNDDEDYKKFAIWERTEIERQQMEAGRGIFDNNNTPLTPEQEEWLVLANYELRNNTKGIADPYNMDSLVGATVNQEYVERVLQKFDSDTEILLQNARSRFSPPQLRSIRAFRQQLRVGVESRLWNMSRTTSGAR